MVVFYFPMLQFHWVFSEVPSGSLSFWLFKSFSACNRKMHKSGSKASTHRRIVDQLFVYLNHFALPFWWLNARQCVLYWRSDEVPKTDKHLLTLSSSGRCIISKEKCMWIEWLLKLNTATKKTHSKWREKTPDKTFGSDRVKRFQGVGREESTFYWD